MYHSVPEVVIHIEVLVHTDVHQIPFVARGDCTVVKYAEQATVVINNVIGVIRFTTVWVSNGEGG